MQVGHIYLLFEAKPMEHLMRRKKSWYQNQSLPVKCQAAPWETQLIS